MSELPIFGISRLRQCHVSLTCPEAEREAGDGGMCVCACVRACVRETERTPHHRHVSIFMCLSL